jgi:LuxR family transcriptional regulator, maltose regulon positive regulatory protein
MANVAQSLLATKLAVPPVRTDVVVRDRLLDRLRQGCQNRLTLVAAPAGFGKTTLLADWIHGDSIPVGWVTLDSADDDLTRFWTYAITALGRMFGPAADVALSLLHSPQPPAIESVLIPLINGLAEGGGSGTLVFDDYHLVTSPEVHASVSFLIDNLPREIHLIIATRADPPLPLARLRTRGQLTEVRADDLRFTASEAADFLQELLGPKLSAADVAALESRTEGWIAGLQLAALSLRGREDVSGFVRAFTGSHRFVVDYLAQEVLAQLPESTQSFLFDTAILDRLTGSLADTVTGRQDSAAVLECLERENLFLIALDDERSWYRYHQLFGEVLRHRLQRSYPGRAPELHRRASTWYDENGFVADAIKHAFAAGDLAWCAELVDRAALALLRIGEIATVRGWLGALPENLVRTRPRLAVFQGWVHYFDGQFVPAESFLDDAERQFLDLARAEGQESVVEHLGAIATVRAFIAMSRDDHLTARRSAQTALAQLPPDAPLRGIVTLNLGWAYWCAGEVEAATRAILESIELSRASGNLFGTIVAMAHLAHLRVLQGKLNSAEEIYHASLQEVGGRVGPLPASGITYIGLGRLYQERNDLESASRYLDEGLKRCEGLATAEVTLEGLAALARLRQARGESQKALATFERIDALAERASVTRGLRDICVSVRIELLLRHGRVAEASACARAWKTSAVDPWSRLNGDVVQLTRARVMVAEGNWDDALAILQTIRQSARDDGRWGRYIEIATIEALALSGIGEPIAAAAMLESALALGEPEGYLRVFVDEGAALLAPLALVRASLTDGSASPTRRPTVEYIDRIVAAIRQESEEPAAQVVEGPKPNGESAPEATLAASSLSERELEVLRLIAEGHSNRDIADRLVLAVSTVKWYVNNIYAKLEVDSRTKAVARARAAKLIAS